MDNGESWFLHFQDVDEYGRIVHLQPVSWVDDWPVMGEDKNGDGTGDPVLTARKPMLNGDGIKVPQTSDEFNGLQPGLQWQWSANPKPHWYQMSDGKLRLYAMPKKGSNLWTTSNILTQKLPAPMFEAVTKLDVSNLKTDEYAGLLIFGLDYAGIRIS